jgi:hypothetical protein
MLEIQVAYLVIAPQHGLCAMHAHCVGHLLSYSASCGDIKLELCLNLYSQVTGLPALSLWINLFSLSIGPNIFLELRMYQTLILISHNGTSSTECGFNFSSICCSECSHAHSNKNCGGGGMSNSSAWTNWRYQF